MGQASQKVSGEKEKKKESEERLVKVEEDLRKSIQEGKDKLRAEAVKAEQDKAQAEEKAHEEGVAEFKASVEGKAWQDEWEKAFKNFEAGKEWCESLLVDPLPEALREVIEFVKSRAPELKWEGCSYYAELYLGDEDTSLGVPFDVGD